MLHLKKSDQRTFLPYNRQHIDEADIDAVANVLRSDWLTTGPVTEQFEEKLAEKTGARFAVSCANGTAGLHLAALHLGLSENATVIVPANTFVATANAARLTGAKVVIADVDPTTGLMTPETLDRATTRCSHCCNGSVDAIFNVHFAGQCEDMVALRDIAVQNQAALLHDACHALGTEIRAGNRVKPIADGPMEELSVFSFHPVKTVAMGEGGAVVTNSERIAMNLKKLRGHGVERNPHLWENKTNGLEAETGPNPWYYEMQELGLNYRTSDINCALGLSQLEKLDHFVQTRRRLADLYTELLGPHADLVRPLARTGYSENAWHLLVVQIDFEKLKKSRASIMKELRQANIGSQVHYIPLFMHPYYQPSIDSKDPGEIWPGAVSYYNTCLSLPLFVDMQDDDVHYVVTTLVDILKA